MLLNSITARKKIFQDKDKLCEHIALYEIIRNDNISIGKRFDYFFDKMNWVVASKQISFQKF